MLFSRNSQWLGKTEARSAYLCSLSQMKLEKVEEERSWDFPRRLFGDLKNFKRWDLFYFLPACHSVGYEKLTEMPFTKTDC